MMTSLKGFALNAEGKEAENREQKSKYVYTFA